MVFVSQDFNVWIFEPFFSMNSQIWFNFISNKFYIVLHFICANFILKHKTEDHIFFYKILYFSKRDFTRKKYQILKFETKLFSQSLCLCFAQQIKTCFQFNSWALIKYINKLYISFNISLAIITVCLVFQSNVITFLRKTYFFSTLS